MTGAIQEDVRRRQVASLLTSNTFRTCGSLRRLLEYLADCSIDGTARDLKEYRIGVEGLGKDEKYDPRTDPSVRVQVGRLRSKLAEYYTAEGREDSIVITVPKGAFSVVFEDRSFSEPPDAAPVAEPIAGHSSTARRWVLPALLAAACLFAAGFGLSRSGAPAEPTREEQSAAFQTLWQPYLSAGKPALIALGIPMWLRIEASAPDGAPLVGHLRDGLLNEWPAEGSSPEGRRLGQWKRQLQTDRISPAFQYVAVGEAIGAFLLGKALSPYGNPTIVRSNMLSWDSAKDANVVFVGAPKFNSHLRNVPFSRNFRIGNFYVENLQPKSGERSTYPDAKKGTDAHGAALIGRYRSPGGGGWFTMIGSANSMCTWAAIEYLTRPDYVARLTRSMQESLGRVPESFEFVIEARFDQTNPVDIRHVALRDLTDSPGTN